MMDRSSLTPSENTPLDYAAWCASNEQALEVLASFERGLAENAAADPESSVDLASGLQRLREEMDAHQAFEASELLPILDELGAEALREQLLEDHDEIARLASGPALPEAGWRLARLIREHLATQERLLLPLLKGRKFWPATAVEEDGYLILEKRLVGPETWSFVVLAPQVARGRKPGQFFMVAPFSNSERIPLTLAGGDARRGWIRFVMQEAGSTTQAMGRLSAGDRLYAVAGPLGTPTELVDHGTVVLVGGGYGSAAILPAAEALHAKGRRVLTDRKSVV